MAVIAATAIKQFITRFRIWDLVILTASFFITLSSFILVYQFNTNNDVQVIIEGVGQSYIYPISADETIHVQGPLGETLVIIHNGAAHVEESACKDKLCVAMGEISKPNQWVACLPNQVFVRIIGTSAKDDLDGSTY